MYENKRKEIKSAIVRTKSRGKGEGKRKPQTYCNTSIPSSGTCFVGFVELFGSSGPRPSSPVTCQMSKTDTYTYTKWNERGRKERH